jgi:hypothetical protein
MRKLETFVNEKLRVTKSSVVPDLIALIESKDKKDYESRRQQLLEYLKNDSDLPIAELIDWQNGLKKLAKKYQRGYDTFLWIQYGFICYGTWDDMYSVYWSSHKKSVRNYINAGEGFKDFACNTKELTESKGVFIITENKELLDQVDILKQKSEPAV